MLNRIVLNRTDYLQKMDLELNDLQRLICHTPHQKKKKEKRSKVIAFISSIQVGSAWFLLKENRFWMLVLKAGTSSPLITLEQLYNSVPFSLSEFVLH